MEDAPAKGKGTKKEKKTKRPASQIALDKARELRGSIVTAEFSRAVERELLDKVSELRESLEKAVADAAS
jgi:hypothetical protein